MTKKIDKIIKQLERQDKIRLLGVAGEKERIKQIIKNEKELTEKMLFNTRIDNSENLIKTYQIKILVLEELLSLID